VGALTRNASSELAVGNDVVLLLLLLLLLLLDFKMCGRYL
jgi:hypothetical protein